MNLLIDENNHTTNFNKGLMLVVRALLILSVIALITSSILMLSFGLSSEIAFGIMWFSVMGSIFIYYFSILSIIGIAAYYKIKKLKVWDKIRKEVILLAISIICLLILALINNYVILN